MTDDTLLDLDITDVAHGGVFVGRHEGRVVFVPDTLPGERVRVRLTQTRSAAFWRGEVVDVRDASPDRVPHVWSEASLEVPSDVRPGGADFGHIRRERQRELKRTVLADALQRIGQLTVPVSIDDPLPEPAVGPNDTRWRTRVSVHVDDEGRVGPLAARSHRVVPVSSLPLATEEIEAAYRAIRGAAPGRVDIVHSSTGEVQTLPRPDGRRRTAPVGPITETVGGRRFALSADGFWQVHPAAAGTLTDRVARALAPTALDPDAWHLDLYGGVGLFARTLADLAGPHARLTTVESARTATQYAARNLADLPRARAETGRVDRWLSQLEEWGSDRDRDQLRRGVVLLDPPRAGAGREVALSLARLSPERIVYVACDPAALARDLGTFAQQGYETQGVEGIDLFPHTHHVEAIAVLERR